MANEVAPQPLITFVTRCYLRPTYLSKNTTSLKSLTDPDWEQVFLVDNVGYGIAGANRALSLNGKLPSGKYVMVLDDDDRIIYPDFIKDLRQKIVGDPDIVYVKMRKNGKKSCGIYPTGLCWKKQPELNQIAMSCFIVKRPLYEACAPSFNQRRAGDFYFISAAHKQAKRVIWWDKIVSETMRVSKGRPE